jgi:DNA-binding MarR family transcriptional regulator
VTATRLTQSLAGDLRVVLGQLMRRLRSMHGFSLSQAAVLGRLDREGTMSIGDIAAAERVRPQSMAQTVADLELDGLIERSPDPADGRRVLVSLTASGIATLDEDRHKREGWIALAIDAELSEHDREVLEEAIGLLQRLERWQD